MIRVVKLTHQLYGYEFDDLEKEAMNIGSFVEQGEPVILVNSLDELTVFDIDPADVKMVSPDDN